MNGDGAVHPIDVLIVVNYINELESTELEGEFAELAPVELRQHSEGSIATEDCSTTSDCQVVDRLFAEELISPSPTQQRVADSERSLRGKQGDDDEQDADTAVDDFELLAQDVALFWNKRK